MNRVKDSTGYGGGASRPGAGGGVGRPPAIDPAAHGLRVVGDWPGAGTPRAVRPLRFVLDPSPVPMEFLIHRMTWDQWEKIPARDRPEDAFEDRVAGIVMWYEYNPIPG